ncbi:MAG: cupin domain-containing protein [bacterium]|nr:cupin domain-containing protein [bacterium]
MSNAEPSTPMMTYLEDVAALAEVQPASTVSRTVMQAEGARLVLFTFDTGERLTEHTAAIPVVLYVLEGHLQVTADGCTVDLRPGDIVHLGTRLPHAVEALAPSKLALLMLDTR